MSVAAHGRMLRKGRVSLAGQVYLLTAVTHAREPWFQDFDNGCLAARTLVEDRLWPDARLLAWVLMPDHLHLLVELGLVDDISLVMQRIKALLSMALRNKLGDVRIWQAGFHDHALRHDESVRAAARYVIANPLRAGLVTKVGDYSFWDAVWLDGSHDPLL